MILMIIILIQVLHQKARKGNSIVATVVLQYLI